VTDQQWAVWKAAGCPHRCVARELAALGWTSLDYAESLREDARMFAVKVDVRELENRVREMRR